MNTIRFILTALLVATLFPSCVQWNIGENILTAAETHVALDYRHPVDNRVYRVGPAGDRARYYARLPEVRYHVMPELLRLDMYDFKGYEVCGSEPTGRVALAEVMVYKDDVKGTPEEPFRLTGQRRERATLPAGAVAFACADDDDNRKPFIEHRREPESAPGPLRRAVASTLSYSIDPLLTFVSTTAFWAVSLPCELLTIPFAPLLHQGADESAEAAKPGR